MSVKLGPSKDELAETMGRLIGNFVDSVDGLTGVIIVGIRQTDEGQQALEVRSLCKLRDIYSASAALIESTLRPEGGVDHLNLDEKKLAAKLADALLTLAGEGDESCLEETEHEGFEDFAERLGIGKRKN
jgi:hypothetical protein